MSIALLVTRGYGNGTLTGAIKEVVTRGYTIGSALAFVAPTHLMAISSENRTMQISSENRIMKIEGE